MNIALPTKPHDTTPPVLELDETSLDPSDLSLPALMRELNLQQRPSWLLAKLMNALEKKRQAKGLGWSRAWNKYGLTVFRTHTQDISTDADYFAPLSPMVTRFLADAPACYQDFAAGLLADPERMAFTFYHINTAENGRQYEGLTLSLGRRVTDDKTKRDRLDLILEDEREDGRVDGMVDRLRLYICPWSAYGPDRSFHLCERTVLPADELRLAQECYQRCVAKYHEWKSDESRQWSHWSARYIDYFGPRQFIPQNSSFI